MREQVWMSINTVSVSICRSKGTVTKCLYNCTVHIHVQYLCIYTHVPTCTTCMSIHVHVHVQMYIVCVLYLLWWNGIELSVAEQGQPLCLLGTHWEEGSGEREGVTATECLHQRPLLLRLQTAADHERGTHIASVLTYLYMYVHVHVHPHTCTCMWQDL